jgi:hypothetical protein
MKCKHCGREIYWYHVIYDWKHIDANRRCDDSWVTLAEPKVENEEVTEVPKGAIADCTNCGKEIIYITGKGWFHQFGEELTSFCARNLKSRAEPKGKPIPTDCIKCNEIRYTGTSIGIDRACCHLVDMDDRVLDHFLFVVGAKGIPETCTPPTWCPLKVNELCGYEIPEHDLACQLPKGHSGRHEQIKSGLTHTWDTYDSRYLDKLTQEATTNHGNPTDLSGLFVKPIGIAMDSAMKGETIGIDTTSEVGVCVRLDKLKEMLEGMIAFSDYPLAKKDKIRNKAITEIIAKLEEDGK